MGDRVLVPSAEGLAGIDAGLLWHCGNPLAEQRLLEAGGAYVRLANRECFTISGEARFDWLNSLCSQQILPITDGVTRRYETYILDAQGRIEHGFVAFDDGERLFGYTEPGQRRALLDYLTSMKFRTKVELAEAEGDVIFAVSPGAETIGNGITWVVAPGAAISQVIAGCLPGVAGGSIGAAGVPEAAGDGGVSSAIEAGATKLDVTLTADTPEVGIWAYEAWRIASGVPRLFVDTDNRTLPNELYMPVDLRLGPAVHLRKGCYRGQETVAKVYNVGKPPRRLTRLLLDGSRSQLPASGAPIFIDGKHIGMVGSSVVHHELGPIALALLKRDVPVVAELVVASTKDEDSKFDTTKSDTVKADTVKADLEQVDATTANSNFESGIGIAASQEPLVDPEVGLHVKFGQ